MDLLIFSNQEYYPEYHDWRLFSTQCKLHPEAKVTSYLYGHSKNLRNSLKFLLALQRVVFFVTFRLCWQHCKLLGDPEWPQLEMRTGFFPLEDTNYMYPPYSTARTKVWYFQWYFGTAASHKRKSQWKWKLKNRTKNNARTYRSFFKPQERITLKWIYCFVNFLLLSILCSLIVISCVEWTHGYVWKVLSLKFLAKPIFSAEADRFYGKVTMLTCGREGGF